jgi:hypothetical protein
MMMMMIFDSYSFFQSFVRYSRARRHFLQFLETSPARMSIQMSPVEIYVGMTPSYRRSYVLRIILYEHVRVRAFENIGLEELEETAISDDQTTVIESLAT